MKKMKKALALSLALVMSATLFGCAPKENPAANSPTASDPAASTQSSQSGEERQDHDEIVIKLGASSASTEPTGIAGQKFADLVNERLAGRVRVEYYPGEQLGAAMEEVENMQVDLQQGAIFSFDNYSSIAKDLNIMSMALRLTALSTSTPSWTPSWLITHSRHWKTTVSILSHISCKRTLGPSLERSL